MIVTSDFTAGRPYNLKAKTHYTSFAVQYKYIYNTIYTNNIETVEVCQFYFGVSLPSVVLRNRSERFEHKFRIHSELLKAPV